MSRDRITAAKAALRAHHETRNSPGHHIPGRGFFTVAANPDLEANVIDLIADALHMAQALGLDPALVARCATGHFEEESDA